MKWVFGPFLGLFFSVSAQAHVLSIPYPDVGSLQDAHKAAFFMPQTYLPQIAYNLLSPPGGSIPGYFWSVFQSGTSGPLKMLQGIDGVNWNYKGVSYTPCNAGGYVRDPSIAKFAAQNKHYIVHTNTTFGVANTKFDLAVSSDNASTFTCVQQIDMSSVSSGANSQIWAPEWAHNDDGTPWLDPNIGGCPRVYVAASSTGLSDTGFQIYETHPTNCSDFSQAWSAPVLVTGTSLPNNLIDAYPVVSGSAIKLWIKNENDAFVGYLTSTTSAPTSGYVVTKSGNWAGWGSSLEGESVIQTPSALRIYLDSLGGGYTYSDSFDGGTTWSTRQSISAPFTAQHGTVINAALPAATCNGDKRSITSVVTTSIGSPNLSTSTNVFVPSDQGKTISVPGLSSAGINGNYSTILTYVDASHVVLVSNVLVNLNSSLSFGVGTDDTPGFAAFNAWALANQGSSQVVLTIPNGSSCWFGSSASVGNNFARGINNLVVEGTGATLNSVDGAQFGLGGGVGICNLPINNASGCSARIQTVSAGASQVQLTAASLAAGYVSRFTATAGLAGNWILVSGINPQAIVGSGSGQPPNLTFFEWRRITNVNAGTGVITLDRPLTYPYKSDWPLYQDGSVTGEGDQGGPATIYAVDQYWNATAEYRGLTVNQGVNQTYAKIRNVTYRNVTFGGGFGAIPTQNEAWSAIGSSFPGVTMETDKLVGSMLLDNTSVLRIDFQSSSTQQFTARNGSSIGTLFGSGNTTTITDTTFDTLRPGAFAYGATLGPFTCVRCKVTTDFRFNGGIAQNLNPSVTSMSAGVISFLNSNATGGNGPPSRVYIPGGNVFFTTPGFASLGIFDVQAMTQDPTSTFIQTNQAGGFPSTASLGGGVINYQTHPAPQFTCTDPDPASVVQFIGACTNAGATALKPLGEFARRTYAPTATTANLGDMNAWGKIVRLTIDVTQNYTGTGSQTLNPTGQFHLNTIKQSNWTPYDWVPSINTKVVGKRVITPSGTTCDTGGGPVAGACSGDACTQPISGCFTLPEAVWISDVISPSVFGTFASGGGGVNAQYTITLETDQGVVP